MASRREGARGRWSLLHQQALGTQPTRGTESTETWTLDSVCPDRPCETTWDSKETPDRFTTLQFENGTYMATDDGHAACPEGSVPVQRSLELHVTEADDHRGDMERYRDFRPRYKTGWICGGEPVRGVLSVNGSRTLPLIPRCSSVGISAVVSRASLDDTRFPSSASGDTRSRRGAMSFAWKDSLLQFPRTPPKARVHPFGDLGTRPGQRGVAYIDATSWARSASRATHGQSAPRLCAIDEGRAREGCCPSPLGGGSILRLHG